MKLKDKVAVVTGSGAGIGRGIALEMAKEGAKIVVNVSRSIDDAEETVKMIEDLGGEAIYVRANVTKLDEVKNLRDKALEAFGSIDILVNNAGISDYGKELADTEDEEWYNMVDINLNSIFLVTKYMMPELLKGDGGKVINLGSIASYEAGSGFGYVATKHAVQGFTKELANVYGRKNINANAICPGAVESKMTAGMFEEEGPFRDLLLSTPAQRLAKAEEIGKAAVFLASKDAEFIHGASLVIDGGWLIK